MAHKDYVARGRNPKTPPEPEKRALPWVRIVVTLALLFGFGYFLWSINDKAEDPAHKKASTKSEQLDPLPDAPEEEWEFIKTLPEYSVEVDVEEREASEKRYLMQCGSVLPFKVWKHKCVPVMVHQDAGIALLLVRTKAND